MEANFFVTSNVRCWQTKIDNVRMMTEKIDDLDLENPSTNVLRKFESIKNAIEREGAETVGDGEQDSYKIEVIRYAEKASLINSEIEANLASVSAEIRMLVRAWMEQNWESRYSAWGQLFAILEEGEQLPTPEQLALRGKPKLIALFERLNYLSWQTIDENDERNLQRLNAILLIHRIEIERPRGERKARLKKLPS
jgi:hypothetical protein